MSETAVLVVGAGPVGLAAANTLLLHGIRPRLIERLPAPVNQSRAAGIQSRTLEVLERLGLVEQFLAGGTQIHGARIYDGEKKLLGHVELDQVDAPYPIMLGLGQTATEHLLTEALAAQGLQIERNVELLSMAQNAGEVIATLRGANGETEEARCQYLIGCDGGKSTVRHQLGLPMEGETIDSFWITADCHVDWEFPRDEAVAFLAKEGFLFAMAIEQDRWRIITPLAQPLPAGRQATLEDAQAVCDRLLPVKARLHTPHWVTQFGLNTRMTPAMQVGRVFLCGDASHIHSPVGGQGMNTGIQDAFNLGWKLALRMNGKAGDTLLESFNTERHANAKRMLGGVGPGTKVVNLRSPVAVAVRNTIAHFALQFDAVRERMRMSVSELDVNYRRSPVVGEHHQPLSHWYKKPPQMPSLLQECADFGGGPRPGERAPDIEELQDGSGAPSRLFARWVRNPRSQVLVFAGDADAARTHQLKEMVQEINGSLDGLLEAALIQAGDSAGPGLRDPGAAGHHRYGSRHESLYWIRPDGYVAFRSQPADLEALRSFFLRVMS